MRKVASAVIESPTGAEGDEERGRSSGGVSEQGRRMTTLPSRRGRGRSMRREHDFRQPAGKDERAERGVIRRSTPRGRETWVHIRNPSSQGRAQG